MTRISTVIVTWNQAELTIDCLRALDAAGMQPANTWLVDNGSSPDVLPAIRARFPRIQTLRLDVNRGFAGGCNAGASAALESGTDYIFLLNNDALVTPETLPALLEAIERDSRVAAVSPKVYYDTAGKVIQSVGLAVDPASGQARMLGANQPDHGQYDQVAERDALFGCALLIRRAAWQQVGPFWEPFFNYAEETDWCLRARELGWRLLYVGGAAVRHRTSSSLGWDSPLKVYLITRNQLYLRQRHRPAGWRAWRGLTYALYVGARAWARYMRRGQRPQARALWLAWWDYARDRTGDRRTNDLRLKEINRYDSAR
ncbi:MAG TPA: glycosyltransferase family 2 protein [Roseiflexaceae bacterium]|nr:glycosyltransferase family 2 protein [Roseiflexaceae bacterium]